MKAKKLKTKKQIKKETIDFYVNLINLNEEEGKIEGLKEDLESDIESSLRALYRSDPLESFVERAYGVTYEDHVPRVRRDA